MVAGSFSGDDITLVSPNYRGCAQLRLLDDNVMEGTETLQLSLVTDNINIGTSVNANFVFDPNVTEVCILDDDQRKGFLYNIIVKAIITHTLFSIYSRCSDHHDM